MLLNGDIYSYLKGYRTVDIFNKLYKTAPAEEHLSKIQYIDIKTYLCDDILTKVDRASMAVSLEVRCPLLDHVFMEYVAGIPARYKRVGAKGKYIFKEALKSKGYLPKNILYRRKMGFAVPICDWLRNELRDYSRQLIFDGEATRQILQKGYLETIWEKHLSHEKDYSSKLWSIMMLNLWYRKYGNIRRY